MVLPRQALRDHPARHLSRSAGRRRWGSQEWLLWPEVREQVSSSNYSKLYRHGPMYRFSYKQSVCGIWCPEVTFSRPSWSRVITGGPIKCGATWSMDFLQLSRRNDIDLFHCLSPPGLRHSRRARARRNASVRVRPAEEMGQDLIMIQVADQSLTPSSPPCHRRR